MVHTKQISNSAPCTPPHVDTLEQLITLLRQEFGTGGIESVDTDRVQLLMESYLSNQNDWKKYCYFNKNHYTRNLVDDGNGKFNLMLLCWESGQESAVHDHSNSHCFMKVLAGELAEIRYAWPQKNDCVEDRPLEVIQQNTHGLNDVAYMHDKIGLHKVATPAKAQCAVSLHLYAPPYDFCRTFCDKSGMSKQAKNCPFYSVKGRVCNKSS